jgi:hypothetical protein
MVVGKPHPLGASLATGEPIPDASCAPKLRNKIVPAEWPEWLLTWPSQPPARGRVGEGGICGHLGSCGIDLSNVAEVSADGSEA